MITVLKIKLGVKGRSWITVSDPLAYNCSLSVLRQNQTRYTVDSTLFDWRVCSKRASVKQTKEKYSRRLEQCKNPNLHLLNVSLLHWTTWRLSFVGLDLKGLSHVGMSIFGSSATDATLFTYVYVIKKKKKKQKGITDTGGGASAR